MGSLVSRHRNTGTGRSSVLTEENKNYVRLVLLVTDIGTKAVREVFDAIPIFAPGALAGTLATNEKSQAMKGVPGYLRNILYPSVPGSKILTSSDFDITMMIALLSKIYWPPKAAWGDTEKKIMVIKDRRNALAHSKDTTSISSAEFKTMWSDVSRAILALVPVASKPNYQQQMHDIKNIPIGNKEFIEVIKLVEGIVRQLQDDVSDLQLAIGEVQKGQDASKKEQMDIKSKVDDVQASQTDIKNTQTELKSKVDHVQASQTDIKNTQTELKSKVDLVQASQTDIKNTQTNLKSKVDDVQASQSGLKSDVDDIRTEFEKLKVDQPSTSQAFGFKLMKYLKDYYTKYRAGVQCNPLKPKDTMPLKDIYIKLVWIKDYHQSDGKSVPLSHYREIFQRHPSEKEIEKLITKILVQGKAGVGKTTFSKVLVYDWANENEPYLERFEAIFLLTMRNVKPEQSLVEIVKEQLLPCQPELVEGLKDYIENSEKSLFVFDGLDELGRERSQEIDKILNGFYLNNACFLITSRPWLVQDLVLTDEGIDQLVRIEGFNPQNVEMFIKKVFANLNKSNIDLEKVQETSSKLFQEIKNRELFDLVKVPLILNMVCLLFYYENNLPNTLYKLYKKIRELLYKKGTKKAQQDINDLHEILMKLGKLALEGLLKENDQLFFEFDEVIALVGEKAFEIGLISCEMMKGRMESDTQVYFLHKSFQENLAAYYVGQEMDKKNEQPWEEMKNQISTVKKLRNKALLLEFMAGESLVLCGKIQEYLDVMILEALHNGDRYDVRQILELHSKCLKNMQSTLHPEYIPDNISCDEELVRFAQSSNSVPWIYLQGKVSIPFCFTEITVSLLSQIVDNNTCPCSVYIGEECQCDLKWMKLLIKILKNHRNIKYKYITLGAVLGYSNEYGKEGWEELFQSLLGIKDLLGLELDDCDIPLTVFQSLGRIINTNANTLFVLNLGFNHSIQGQFHLITTEVRTQDPLVLSVLYLYWCLNSSDSKSFSEFLQKTKNMKRLNLGHCECEVSHSVVELQKLRWLTIAYTVNSYTKEKMSSKTMLSSLHRLENLEVFYAYDCEINDSEIETLQLEKLNKIKYINLRGNSLSDKVRSQIKEHCNGRGITCEV